MRSKLPLVLVALLLLLTANPARAGNGNVSAEGDGSHTFDFTVYIADSKTPYPTALAAWKNNLLQAHKMMWIATDGLLRFGKVRIGRHPSMRSRADLVVENSGHAAVSFSAPIPEAQTRLGSTDQVSIYTVQDATAPMTTIHELGHYVFALGDEYLSTLWEKDAGGAVKVRQQGDRQTSYCSVPTDLVRNPQQRFPNHTSIMYDNNEPLNIYQFCAGDHKGSAFGDSTRTWWWTTDQHRMYRASCWTTIARFFNVPVPTTVPQRTGNPPTAPVFEELAPEVALAVLIQNDLPEPQMTEAMNAAQQALRQLRPVGHPGLPGSTTGDRAWIGLAGTGLTALYDGDLLNPAAQDQAVASVTGLTPGAEATNLEASLLALSAAMGPQYLKSSKTILLVTNGAGVTSFSPSLIQALRKADICVDVVALEENQSAQALLDLSAQTLGTLRAAIPQGMPGRANALFVPPSEAGKDGGDAAEGALGGHAIASFSGTFTPGTPQTVQLPVDTLNDALQLELQSPQGGALVLELRDPDGRAIDLQNPPANVQVETWPGGIDVYVEDPASGTWSARVDGANAAAWDLDLGGIGEAMASSPLQTGARAAWPAATLLQVAVEGEERVIGCQVQAQVTAPNQQVSSVTLYDDGDLAFHGDKLAGDGLYSNYLATYPASGEYEVEFQVVNVDGQYTTKRLRSDGPGTTGPVGPAPAFRRLVRATLEVTGVPFGGGTALLPPNGLVLSRTGGGWMVLTWTDTNQGTAGTVVQHSAFPDRGFVDAMQEPVGITKAMEAYGYQDEAVYYRLLARNAEGRSLPGEVAYLDLAQANAAPVYTGSASPLSSSSGLCFIATAAYGSHLEPHVQALRDFRDRALKPNAPGRAFIRLYERCSPPLANWIARRPWARAATRVALTPVVLAVEHPLAAGAGLAVLGALGLALLRRRRLRRAA